MHTTPLVLRILRACNAEARVSEDQVRHLLRREPSLRPKVLSGRFLWFADDIRRLAEALGLKTPKDVADATTGAV